MSKRAKQFNRDWISVIIFLCILAGIMAIFSFLAPQFMTANNLLRALKHLSVTSLAALGLTFVVVVGHSDMSFAFVSCFAGMTMSYFIGIVGWPPVPSIIMGLLGGMIFGFLNGIAVGRFKLPDMIVTIGIGSFAWGLAYLYNKGNYIYTNFLTSGIIEFSDGRLLGIPFPVIYLFLFYIVAYLLLHRTKYGRGFYSVGSNRIAAVFSGIKIERYIIAAFVISCTLASFTNMVMTAAQGNGNVKGGLVLLLPAWAAVFIGISVFKKPTVIGTFLGAFLLSIMQNGFTLLNAPFYIMDLIVGLTLILSIVISRIEFRKKVKEVSPIDTFQAAA